MSASLKKEPTTPVVLRPDAARARVALGKSTFHDIQNPRSRNYDRSFPRSFSLVGGRARAYLACEVDEWILKRAATRHGGSV